MSYIAYLNGLELIWGLVLIRSNFETRDNDPSFILPVAAVSLLWHAVTSFANGLIDFYVTQC